MAFDYDEARELALELITEFGGAGEFIKLGSSGGYDAHGNVTAATDDVIISGTVTPVVDYTGAEIDGSMIKKGDGWVFFHSDIAPEIGYTVTISGVMYRIVSIESLTSVDDTNVYRLFQLRK